MCRHSQGLRGLDRLDPGLVVILMDLLVDGGGDNLVLVRPDVLVRHGGPDVLVHRGIVLAIPGEEVCGCLLSLLHGGPMLL